ncbi:MAG: hypothetical protein LBB26_00750 [Puniceicoccales bacterium]|jgi:hypothetical protein|nr:hypothetical protein [Puniceicoccales bacterium]
MVADEQPRFQKLHLAIDERKEIVAFHLSIVVLYGIQERLFLVPYNCLTDTNKMHMPLGAISPQRLCVEMLAVRFQNLTSLYRHLIYGVLKLILMNIHFGGPFFQQPDTASGEIRSQGVSPASSIQAPVGIQHVGQSAPIAIDRDAEIAAMDIGRQFAANPERKAIRQRNMNAFSQDIRYGVQNGSLKEFTPGWAIIGDKPGGVEGGFTIRRVYMGDMASFFQDSPEGFAQLQKISQENSLLLPPSLWAENLGDKTLHEALSQLPQSQRNETAKMVMDLTPAYCKSYMVKVVFGKGDVESDGTVFCKPNPKGRLHRLFTKRSSDDINREVLQEFAALQVTRALSPDLAPEVLLGNVKTNGHKDRYFLMTEMAGSGDSTASFQTLGEADVEKGGVDEKFAGLSYALTVGLLGDRDANKNGNVGLLKRGDGLPQPFLFDLGHPVPNGYELDAATLLPKKTSEGSTGFYLGKLNKSDVLDVNKRRAHLVNLLAHRMEIEEAMQLAIGQIPPESPGMKVLTDMGREFAQRMDYLYNILQNSAPATPAVEPQRRRRFASKSLRHHQRPHTKPA